MSDFKRATMEEFIEKITSKPNENVYVRIRCSKKNHPEFIQILGIDINNDDIRKTVVHCMYPSKGSEDYLCVPAEEIADKHNTDKRMRALSDYCGMGIWSRYLKGINEGFWAIYDNGNISIELWGFDDIYFDRNPELRYKLEFTEKKDVLLESFNPTLSEIYRVSLPAQLPKIKIHLSKNGIENNIYEGHISEDVLEEIIKLLHS